MGIRRVGRYFWRSARLRRPVCGVSPLFLPAKRTENITDWFTMRPGCPRCRYAYDREPGYYLFALWMISFILVSICGVGQMLLIDYLVAQPSTALLLIGTLFPVTLFTILSVRHIKAFYLALDHLIHPHWDEQDQD